MTDLFTKTLQSGRGTTVSKFSCSNNNFLHLISYKMAEMSGFHSYELNIKAEAIPGEEGLPSIDAAGNNARISKYIHTGEEGIDLQKLKLLKNLQLDIILAFLRGSHVI